MSQGRIIIVSGPSGVGKGTILRTVMQQHESLHYSVSATSRPMRPEDREGMSYYFVSRERFEEMIAAGELLEHACYAGNYYGTPLRPVEEALARGESVVLEIDVQGALQVMQRRPDAISVFIAPPSYAELKRRLAGRGDTPPDIAARRLHTRAGGMLQPRAQLRPGHLRRLQQHRHHSEAPDHQRPPVSALWHRLAEALSAGTLRAGVALQKVTITRQLISPINSNNRGDSLSQSMPRLFFLLFSRFCQKNTSIIHTKIRNFTRKPNI